MGGIRERGSAGDREEMSHLLLSVYGTAASKGAVSHHFLCEVHPLVSGMVERT